MKARLKTALVLIVFGLMVMGTVKVKAQCSQCSAQVATNQKNGGSAANGLNKGILFLLAAPYLAVAIGGYVWYRNYKRKNVNLQIRNEKLHLN
jgi:UPF0716 family protein affecting phage T7 exclusion